MPITASGEKNLVRALVAELGITQRQARTAVTNGWMMIATATDVDWRQIKIILDTFDHSGENCVRLVFEDRMIATLTFPAGVLPKTVLQQAWAEYDAYLADEAKAGPYSVEIPADIIEIMSQGNPTFAAMLMDIASEPRLDLEPVLLTA